MSRRVKEPGEHPGVVASAAHRASRWPITWGFVHFIPGNTAPRRTARSPDATVPRANAAVLVLPRVPATAPRLSLLWARWFAAQGARKRWPGPGRPRRAKQCCRPCGSLRRRPPAIGLLLAGETAPGPRQRVRAWPEQRWFLPAVAHPAVAASSSNPPGAESGPALASARQVHHGVLVHEQRPTVEPPFKATSRAGAPAVRNAAVSRMSVSSTGTVGRWGGWQCAAPADGSSPTARRRHRGG